MKKLFMIVPQEPLKQASSKTNQLSVITKSESSKSTYVSTNTRTFY